MNRASFKGMILALLGTAALLAGCGGGSSAPGDPNLPPVTGLLKPAASAAELEDSLKAGFTTIAASTSTTALAAGDSQSGSPATGTYTQELNVDEFDAVRYDGEHLYIAPRRYLDCCFLASNDGATNSGSPASASIRILATDPGNASAALVSTIPLENGVSVQGMYTAGDRLFALTAKSAFGNFGPAWASLAIWVPDELGYRVYDTSDKANPSLVADVAIEGIFVDSRRIGNTVYIVSRYTPDIQGIIHGPTTSSAVAHNQALLANVSLSDMLPSITVNGSARTLVDPTRCYIPNDGSQPAYAVITNVTAVPLDNPAAFTNTCYNDSAYGAYVSETSIYFTQLLEETLPENATTRIHKFALSGTSISYRGSGEVAGQVWRGGQADFRMSEHEGELRVFSSDFDWNRPDDFVDHHLFVLREAGGDLEVVGRLPNANNPDPIGKPNEQLYGVRFLGDRAYAVTFEQIDPLYVFDLSDPANPVIAGELEVEGFSDFLHPVTDDLLLGLGTSVDGAIKLELYDVSDISAPLSRGLVLIGGQGAYSEARSDRHAFTWQPDVNGVDRFTVPVSVWESDGTQGSYQTALYLFEIHDKTMPNLASLVPAGEMSPPGGGVEPWTQRNRAFIHDDTIYYVRHDAVWSAFWTSPGLVNGPY